MLRLMKNSLTNKLKEKQLKIHLSIGDNQWSIGVCDWIIQDGNYPDFNVGQSSEFALEFYSKEYLDSPIQQKLAEKCGRSKYRINAEVIFLSDEEWVIDFGIRAYSHSRPPNRIKLHSFITAEIYLGIDIYTYFEFLYELKEIPPLIYSWRVDSIYLRTHNLYESISQTDAWEDHKKYDGFESYDLICTKIDSPPTHKFVNPEMQWVYEP